MFGSTFLRAVGFFALGTSLCLPFFIKGLVESRGLCAIFSSFFWIGCCLGTTGKPPPTKTDIFLLKVICSKSIVVRCGHYPPDRVSGLVSCRVFWDCFFSRTANMFPMSSWTGTLLFLPETFSVFWKYYYRCIKNHWDSNATLFECKLTCAFFIVSVERDFALSVLSIFSSAGWCWICLWFS